MRLSQGEVPPPFGSLPGGFSWLGPIDHVRVPYVVRLRCVTSGGSRTCTIFFVYLRLPSPYSKASIARRDPWLDLLLLCTEWTTSFSILFVTLIFATLFLGS